MRSRTDFFNPPMLMVSAARRRLPSPVGLPLAGFLRRAQSGLPCEAEDDTLEINAVAFQDGDQAALLIAIDTLIAGPDLTAAADALAREASVPGQLPSLPPRTPILLPPRIRHGRCSEKWRRPMSQECMTRCSRSLSSCAVAKLARARTGILRRERQCTSAATMAVSDTSLVGPSADRSHRHGA